MPVKDKLGNVINYEVTIFKSGYNSAFKDVGEIIEDNELVEIELDAQSGTTDIMLALLDYEQNYRANDFLTRNKLLFTDITGNLDQTTLSDYKIICLGYDASKYSDFVLEFIVNKTDVLNFVENGGTLFFFQQNDAGWDSTFFPVPIALEDESGGNDLETGIIIDSLL